MHLVKQVLNIYPECSNQIGQYLKNATYWNLMYDTKMTSKIALFSIQPKDFVMYMKDCNGVSIIHQCVVGFNIWVPS